MLAALVRHGRRHQIDDFLAQGDGCGWCRHPIRLRGHVVSGHTGEESVRLSSASLPDGVLLKACGSRSEVRCPACAEVYRGDARHLVRAGLEGGKGVPESVADHPAVFLTLTAPGFGTIHATRASGVCHARHSHDLCEHGRPTTCERRHVAGDDLVGTPLCVDCYDYVGAVLHNAHTPELWRRTMISLQRRLASLLGVTQSEVTKVAPLSFCRVAEFQRRGVVHLHAIVRVDGSGPSAVTAHQLASASLEAARGATVRTGLGSVHWGTELDAQILENGEERTTKVARYVAKYATKSSSEHPGLDARIASLRDLDGRGLPSHLHRMAATALELDSDTAFAHLKLARHAHRLGFGGHFLTKSREYSTTFSALRTARVQWREARRFGGLVPEGHRSVGQWRAVGAGWANQGEELFAASQQRQRARDRKEVMSEWYSRSE